MKNWKSLGITLALGAVLVGGIPLISYAATASDATQNTPGNGLGIGRTGTPMIDTISKILGLTTDEIRDERQEGKSLSDIAGEKGVTKESLLNQMVKARQTQLDALVKDGTLTKEQADDYLAQMKERMSTMIEKTETGRPDFAPGRGQERGMQKGNCTGIMGQQGTGDANL